MRRVLSTLGVASILIGAPLAASAHDGDRGWRGYDGRGHYQPKPKHVHKYYTPAPPVAYRLAPPVVYYPVAPRVVERPVYVPAPPPAPGPWPFNQVDIGFRIFF
jgi:hypothetical protein